MQEQEINDLIFKELIKRGYSLEGKTRVWNIADSKLWYLTPEQAQAFLDLEHSEAYDQDVIRKEIDLITANMPSTIKRLKKGTINLIDLGCGDGKKSVLFIKALNELGFKIRYYPIDISDYMVNKAMERISQLKIGEVIKFQWNISDFENLENVMNLINREKADNTLLLLLGNTLGNFEINELLYEIKSCMNTGDLLLIGNGLSKVQEIDATLGAYNNPFLDNLLSKTLTQIGLKKEDIEYGARFKNSRIEMYYTLKKDVKISFLDKTVYFSKGDQIIVALSYKYNKEDMLEFMKLYFKKLEMFTSPDGSYALVLSQV